MSRDMCIKQTIFHDHKIILFKFYANKFALDLKMGLQNGKEAKDYISQSLQYLFSYSLSKILMSKYLFALLLFSLLFITFVKKPSLVKICPKLNFRQNLYKSDISLKRTIFFLHRWCLLQRDSTVFLLPPNRAGSQR